MMRSFLGLVALIAACRANAKSSDVSLLAEKTALFCGRQATEVGDRQVEIAGGPTGQIELQSDAKKGSASGAWKAEEGDAGFAGADQRLEVTLSKAKDGKLSVRLDLTVLDKIKGQVLKASSLTAVPPNFLKAVKSGQSGVKFTLKNVSVVNPIAKDLEKVSEQGKEKEQDRLIQKHGLKQSTLVKLSVTDCYFESLGDR